MSDLLGESRILRPASAFSLLPYVLVETMQEDTRLGREELFRSLWTSSLIPQQKVTSERFLEGICSMESETTVIGSYTPYQLRPSGLFRPLNGYFALDQQCNTSVILWKILVH